jgi:hypothetical protein
MVFNLRGALTTIPNEAGTIIAIQGSRNCIDGMSFNLYNNAWLQLVSATTTSPACIEVNLYRHLFDFFFFFREHYECYEMECHPTFVDHVSFLTGQTRNKRHHQDSWPIWKLHVRIHWTQDAKMILASFCSSQRWKRCWKKRK